ncbi:hypothetical protein [Raineya orbicola]|jgi:hypothetical protein|uniref:Uncharacterized protein n=1 Tax=Raineya orbicola TaxID=2016530 RepID=A0A2N3IJY8_9BACT|nr:hypothetical protein [Raineya orbicola]PKQ70652.1 hypothetical protein Rain11_0382 [Raineya orbicola]
MKELLKHLPAIKKFVEERTQAIQELSDNTVKNFLREAYKLPFLFPVRIIVSEEKFVNFLFDMRKDLFDGKNIFFASETGKNEQSNTEVLQNSENNVKENEQQYKQETKVKKVAKTTTKQENNSQENNLSENVKKTKKVTSNSSTTAKKQSAKTTTQTPTLKTKKVKA